MASYQLGFALFITLALATLQFSSCYVLKGSVTCLDCNHHIDLSDFPVYNLNLSTFRYVSEREKMAIVYAVVARGTTVLAEFSAVTGNTGAVARRILEKLPDETESRLCFSQDRYIFHILRLDGITFLCMANETFGRRIPFSYLEDIHMRFMKNYGKVASYAPAYSMNDEFSRVLHQQMEFFSSNPSADTLNRVRGEVGEIRTIMVDNIEKILERGDRIELLVDKTGTMQDNAFHFRKQSKRLRRALWMKNAKLLGLLTCLIVLFLYLIIAACCGGITLPSCRS